MIKHSDGGHPLLREVQEELTRQYPYLKIETQAIPIPGIRRTVERPISPDKTSGDKDTRDWLKADLGIYDSTTVRELEDMIAARFGVTAQVFRRSGKFWIETQMTRSWSLKQQNDLGRDLSTGFR